MIAPTLPRPCFAIGLIRAGSNAPAVSVDSSRADTASAVATSSTLVAVELSAAVHSAHLTTSATSNGQLASRRLHCAADFFLRLHATAPAPCLRLAGARLRRGFATARTASRDRLRSSCPPTCLLAAGLLRGWSSPQRSSSAACDFAGVLLALPSSQPPLTRRPLWRQTSWSGHSSARHSSAALSCATLVFRSRLPSGSTSPRRQAGSALGSQRLQRLFQPLRDLLNVAFGVDGPQDALLAIELDQRLASSPRTPAAAAQPSPRCRPAAETTCAARRSSGTCRSRSARRAR